LREREREKRLLIISRELKIVKGTFGNFVLRKKRKKRTN